MVMKPEQSSRRLPSWRAMHADTAPWAEEIQFRFFREAPAWRKLQVADDLTRGMLQLVQTGLEARHPDDTPAQIRRRLADVVLGEELALRVYGPLSPLNCSTEKLNSLNDAT